MMRQTFLIVLALAALLLAACGAQPEPAAPQADPVEALDLDLSEIEAEAPSLAVTPESLQAPDGDRLMVMDSPVYRGVVEELAQREEGGYALLLSKAAGTNYSFASLHAVTDEYTRANFAFSDLETGSYLEVYYSDALDGDPVTVIAANLLPDADLCVYNGELVLLERDGEGGGSMELKALDGESLTVFHFDESTQFYLNDSDLEPGARLNLFHTGALTRSIPPQGFVLEVRRYTEPE